MDVSDADPPIESLPQLPVSNWRLKTHSEKNLFVLGFLLKLSRFRDLCGASNFVQDKHLVKLIAALECWKLNRRPQSGYMIAFIDLARFIDICIRK